MRKINIVRFDADFRGPSVTMLEDDYKDLLSVAKAAEKYLSDVELPKFMPDPDAVRLWKAVQKLKGK